MKHWWKWLLGILVLLVIVISSGAWYLSKHWKPIIELKLREVIRNSSDSLYTLKYANMDVNVSFGNITLDQVELIPDAAVYQKLVLEKKAPNSQFTIKLNALKIKHFSLTDVFFNRKLSVDAILLDNPEISMVYEHHTFNDTIPTTARKSLYDHIKEAFTSISVDDIRVDNAAFRYTMIENKNSSNFSVQNVNLNVQDILIDSTSGDDSSRLFYAKMIDAQIPGFEYDLPGGFYKIAFDNLQLNTRDNYLELGNFVYKPRMNKAAFFKKLGRNTTMNDVRFSKVRLNKIDFRKLIDTKQLFGSNIELSNGKAAFSQDMRYPGFPKNMIGHDPYQQLMKIKSIYHFDTVYVKNVTVDYSEFSARYDKLGSISFNGATGILTNVTNDRVLLAKNRFMRADLTTKIMDVGKLNVKFGFDMLSKNGYYTYVGTLATMPATAFNRILVPLVNVQIATGDIKGISFNMEATNYKNWGTFKFDYDSLKVNILSMPNDNDPEKSKKTVSFLVNKVLINSSNPDSHGNYIIGKIDYKRVPEYPFFKTIWKSLLQGITQCAGISPEREAKLLSLAATAGKTASGAKKVINSVDHAAKAVGKEVGKDVGKAVHGTGQFFNKLFKKKKEKESEDQE